MAREIWCPTCARSAPSATVTPRRAWIAGALGCVGTLAFLLIGWFVVLFIGLAARHATDAEAYDVAYTMTTAIGLVAPAVAAMIVGGILVHSRRRRVCSICRSAIR